MLTIGDHFPAYDLKGVEGPSADKLEFKDYSSADNKGWSVVFFWPMDFTFVCPTEIAAFGKLNEEFADRDAQILGVSGDSEFVHHAWRRDHKDLGDLPFPMLADVKHELMRACGVEGADGTAQRAVFIVDPNNEIQFVMVTAYWSAVTPRRSCGCWTPCRPTSCARATGTRARPPWTPTSCWRADP